MIKIVVSCLLLCLFAMSSCHHGGDTANRQKQTGDTMHQKLEILNKQIEADASNPDLYNLRAKCYLLDHDFDNALKDVNKAISLDNNKSASFVTLSDIYLLMGKPGESKDALNKAISKNPRDTDALLKLAKLYLIIKDYKNCYATVKQLLAIDNGNASAYFTRAIGLLEQGDTIHAVNDLKQAVDKNQQYFEAFVQLGELYSMKKDPVAELYLKNALTLRPSSREALYILGLYYQETGMYDKAIATYHQLAISDTAFREASYNTGYIYLVYLKDFKKAVQFFSESIKKDPTYFEAFFNRGYAYELSGDFRNAYDDYQKSLKIKVNYDKAIEGLNRLDKVNVKK
ncbi:MAG: tetratricopeptide repeat protein [Bacteroidetes bacterium]|nr:tetratricopeptide repeat protein [Bacteroidota bacterium]